MNQRLINCDFLLKGGFDSQLSNKAKLLYFYLLINADDKGFVGNTNDIIEKLNKNLETGAMLEYNFNNASDELLERGLVYRFMDRHHNQTLLIRHWFMHNKYQKFLTTNYVSYLAQVEIVNNEYHLKSELKEKTNKEKENKVNKETKLNNEELEQEEDEKSLDQILKDLENTPVEKADINDPFYDLFKGEEEK